MSTDEKERRIWIRDPDAVRWLRTQKDPSRSARLLILSDCPASRDRISREIAAMIGTGCAREPAPVHASVRSALPQPQAPAHSSGGTQRSPLRAQAPAASSDEREAPEAAPAPPAPGGTQCTAPEAPPAGFCGFLTEDRPVRLPKDQLLQAARRAADMSAVDLLRCAYACDAVFGAGIADCGSTALRRLDQFVQSNEGAPWAVFMMQNSSYPADMAQTFTDVAIRRLNPFITALAHVTADTLDEDLVSLLADCYDACLKDTDIQSGRIKKKDAPIPDLIPAEGFMTAAGK